VSFVSAFAVGVGLSLDSFSAAIGDSVGRRPGFGRVLRAALPFVVFEIAALSAGWGAGHAVGPYIAAVDHWIAFLLLGGIGLRMIFLAWRAKAASPDGARPSQGNGRLLRRLGTALGTSVDSAAVGVSLALTEFPFLPVVAAVGAATLLLAVAGATIGRYAGAWLGRWAEALGGAVLIVIGIRILVEHLSV